MKIGRWKKLRILAAVLAAGSIYLTGSVAFADDIALQAGTPDPTEYSLINTGTDSWEAAWEYVETEFTAEGFDNWYEKYTVIEVEDEANPGTYKYYIAAGTTTIGTEGDYSTYEGDSYVTATGTSDTSSKSGFVLTEVYLNPAHSNEVLSDYYISSGVKEQVGTQDTLNGKTLGTVNFDSVISTSNVDGGTIANHTRVYNTYNYLIDANGDGNYVDVGGSSGLYGSGYWAYYDETDGSGGLTYNEDTGHFYYNGTLVENKYIYSISDGGSGGTYHLGVFLDDNGDIYTGTVYGSYGEIFSTNISTDETTGKTTFTSFWGEAIDTMDVTLAESNLTEGDLQAMFDVTYANDVKLHEDDLKEVQLAAGDAGSNSGTIAFQTNGEDDAGGEYIPGTITIAGTEGQNGSDAYLTFSNTDADGNEGSFDITVGSTVRATNTDGTSDAGILSSLTINGIEYTVGSVSIDGVSGGEITDDGKIVIVDQDGDSYTLEGQLSDSIADTLELTSDTDTGDGTLTLTSHDKYTGEETAVASVSGIATTENVKNITGASTKTELKEKYENTTYIKDADSLADADVLLDAAIRDTNANVQNIGNQVSRLGTRINRVGAGAAALAALHPMDFDPDDKWSFAGGYGNYRNAHAAAVGAFYRPDEKIMVSMASTVGNDNNMVSLGASFALDRVNHVNNSKVAMAKEIVELRTQLAELSAMVAKMAKGGLVMEDMKLFPDVPENHWAYEYIGKLCAAGIVEGYPDGNFSGDRLMTRYEFAAMLYRALQKGAMLDSRIINEFEPELCRIHVDRIHGEDESRHKIDRVRVTDIKDEETGKHVTDHYGTKIYPNITVEPAKEK